MRKSRVERSCKIAIVLIAFCMQGFVWGAFVVRPDDSKRIAAGMKPSYIQEKDRLKSLGKLEPVKLRPSKKIPGSLLARAEPVKTPGYKHATGETGGQTEKQNGEAEVVKPGKSGSSSNWQLIMFLAVSCVAVVVVWRFRSDRKPDI